MSVCKTVTCSLSSGSSGNSIMVRDGDSAILFDVGLSAKSIISLLESIGTGIKSVSAIFITHEHIDHIKGLKVLSSNYNIPFYVTWEVFNTFDFTSRQKLASTVNILKPKMSVQAGNFEVTSFSTPHDSAGSVGYVVKKHNRKIVGIVTDIGKLTREIVDSICGSEIIYIESNHDLEMLKHSSYPIQLKNRIRSEIGHLSNDDCAKSLPYFIANETKKIMLYHLSHENNTTELALNTAKYSILGGKLNSGTIYLGVAPRSHPSILLECETADDDGERIVISEAVQKSQTKEKLHIDIDKVKNRIKVKLKE